MTSGTAPEGAITEAVLPAPVTRPDGRVYRSRKVTANAVIDEDEFVCGVMVLGTHDYHRAKPLAEPPVIGGDLDEHAADLVLASVDDVVRSGASGGPIQVGVEA